MLRMKSHPRKKRPTKASKLPTGNRWRMQFDGSCENNGSPSATGRWAFRVQSANGTVLMDCGPAVAEWVTCNVAEWQALLHGLEAIQELQERPEAIEIEGDSNLVISVLNGVWQSKKPELTAYRDACHVILKSLGVPWKAKWIPREQNTVCDSMT